MARRSALAMLDLEKNGLTTADILSEKSLENALALHCAFGGSTNLIMHLPAIAHQAGLKRPNVNDWRRFNAEIPRLVDALPNGPQHFATVQVFLAGGVPEVMLHLRDMGKLHLDVMTVTGQTLGESIPNAVFASRKSLHNLTALIQMMSSNPRPEPAKMDSPPPSLFLKGILRPKAPLSNPRR
jgi:dihydroxyacid dehydratase/phosphogluconate dehydratase